MSSLQLAPMRAAAHVDARPPPPTHAWRRAVGMLRGSSAGGAGGLPRPPADDDKRHGLDELHSLLWALDALSPDECADAVVALGGLLSSSPAAAGIDDDALAIADRILHAHELVFSARAVEALLRPLLAAAAGRKDSSSSPSSSQVHALRAIGCVVYANAERCARWQGDIMVVALPLLLPPPTATAPESSPSESSLHAALVCVGNLLLRTTTAAAPAAATGGGKSGSGGHQQHAAAAAASGGGGGGLAASIPLLLSRLVWVLTWATGLPTATVEQADAGGKLLSAALRVLLSVLQLGGEPVREAALRSGDELVRLLHAASLFGLALEQQRASAAAAAATSHARGAGSSASSVRSSFRGIVPAAQPGAPPPPPAGSSGGGVRSASSWYTDSDSGSEDDDGDNDDGDNSERADDDSDSDDGTPRARPARRPAGSGGGGVAAARRSGGASVASGPADGDERWWRDGELAAAGGSGGVDALAGARGIDASTVGGGSRRVPKPRRVPIRARVTALQCVAALARLVPRLLQSRWGVFLPEVQGTHPRPFSPSLLTLHLYDPSSRVREAAAVAVAAIVSEAPLDKWIPVPAAGGGGGSSTGAGAGGARAGRPPPAGGGASTLSDKAAATLRELHVGLQRALSQTDPTRHAAAVAASLRAAAAVVAATPYGRLPALVPQLDALAAQACELLTKLCAASTAGKPGAPTDAASAGGGSSGTLPAGSWRTGGGPTLPTAAADAGAAAEQQHAIVSALHFCGAVCGSPAAAVLGPPLPGAGATAAAAPSPLGRILTTLLALCGGGSNGAGAAPASAALTTLLHTETLTVFAKAARSVPAFVAGPAVWPALSPLAAQAFAAPSPPLRGTALKLLEEVYQARARALLSAVVSPAAAGADDGAGGGADGGGDVDIGGDDDGGGTAPLSAMALALWREFGSASPDGSGKAGLTPVVLLQLVVPRALRDPSPPVRTAALSLLSWLLPADWAAVMGASAEPGTTTSTSANCGLRDALLTQLLEACTDGTASVREGAVRVWGAYASQPAWRTPAFAQLAGGVLLHALLADDSSAVRARASWALGQLVCTGSPMAADVAGPALARADGAAAAGSTAAFTLYPLPGEPEEPLRRRHRCAASVGASLGFHAPSPRDPLPPAALYRTGASQSALVNLLSLPMVRAILAASVRAVSSEGDKVAATAVRALGACVQALLLHWLPLPAGMRHAVDSVIVAAAGARGSDEEPVAAATAAGAGAVRESQRARASGPSPDDALVKQAVLVLADVIGRDSDGGSAPVPPAASAAAKPAPTASWAEVGDGDDRAGVGIRDVIAHRAAAARAGATASATTAPAAATAGVGGSIARGPPSRGPATFAPRSAARPQQAAATATLTPATEPARVAPATKAAVPPPAAPAPSRAPAPSPAASAASVKVRWNACRAAAGVLQLTYRVAITHDTERPRDPFVVVPTGLFDDDDTPVAGAGVNDVNLVASESSNITNNTNSDSSVSGAASREPIVLIPPVRPRVQRDPASGASTSFASVDHVSTARSPFVDRQGPQQQPAAAGAAAVAAPDITTAPAAAAAGGGGTSGGVLRVTDPTLPSVTVGCTWAPPLLAALQRALVGSGNYKVRIAAAQALAVVPSRQSYRIPGDGGDGSDESAATAAGVASAAAGSATLCEAATAYTSPRLQQPGYDGFPASLASLVAALRRCAAAPGDYVDYRYRGALTAAVRVALLRMLPLAERRDYARGQALLEEAAGFLYGWLVLEERAAAAAASGSGGGTGGGGAGGAAGAAADALPAPAAGAAAAAAVVDAANGDARPLSPAVLRPTAGCDTANSDAEAAAAGGDDDAAAVAAAAAELGVLPRLPDAPPAVVGAAFDALAAVYGARVKPGPGVPLGVHAAFRRRVAARAAAAAAAQ